MLLQSIVGQYSGFISLHEHDVIGLCCSRLREGLKRRNEHSCIFMFIYRERVYLSHIGYFRFSSVEGSAAESDAVGANVAIPQDKS